MPARDVHPLLERDPELGSIEDAITRAAKGTAGAVVIEGPAGIGKTAVLQETLDRARRRRFQIFTARGGELEQRLPLGVVRQLFERPLVRSIDPSLMTGPARHATRLLETPDTGMRRSSPPDEFVLPHALHWLCLNLAERGPVLIAVDDAHWADEASLRWLAYHVRRIEEHRVLVTVAVRRPHPVAESQPLREIRSQPYTRTLSLDALSETAAASIVRATLPGADDAFCRACYEATRGNPFFLGEIVAALKAEDISPTASESEWVRRMAPETITHVVLLRVGTLPPHGLAVARAVAVLGARVELRHAATVAGVDPSEAADAADALVAAGILSEGRPLEFVHPVVRTAVYADMPSAARAAAHGRAARILASENAPLDRVANQILAAEPEADPWAVDVLLAAARSAISAGAPAAALPYLRRAADEPPVEAVRPEVLFQLGSAEANTGDPEAAEHIRRALAGTDDLTRRAEMSLVLARTLAPSSYLEAAKVLDEAIDELPEEERDLRLRLEAELLAAARWEASLRPLVRERVPKAIDEAGEGHTSAERQLLGFLAQETALLNHPATAARELARKALAGGHLLAEEGAESAVYHYATDALTFAGSYAEADEASQSGLDDARGRGSVRAFALAGFSRMLLNVQRGSLHDAEADARAVIEASEEIGAGPLERGAAAFLAEILLERRDARGAREALERTAPWEEVSRDPGAMLALAARALIRAEEGRFAEAVEDLHRVGDLTERFDVLTPAVIPWRSLAAVRLAALGHRTEARALVDAELSLARAFGAPRPIGVALRAQGLVEGGDDGIEVLREAVAVLETSGAQLEHARTLGDLGAALRRGNRRKEAREPLRLAADLARECGATAIVERATQELAATGARPRRIPLRGIDALTATERRVATMAAEGMSNRDIAQALFVTVKTVEKHLGQAYAKLGVDSRRALSGALTQG